MSEIIASNMKIPTNQVHEYCKQYLVINSCKVTKAKKSIQEWKNCALKVWNGIKFSGIT